MKAFRISETNISAMELMQSILIFLFLFPLFFQLSGSIFDFHGFGFDSHGQLMLLPLPMAIISCFVGIGLLLRLEDKHFGVGFLFSAFVMLVFSTLVSSGGAGKAEFRKFVQLIQFVLPMFAIVFGSLYLKPRSIYLRFESIALYALLIIVPLEVIATLNQKTVLLSPYLYLFSLYQHLQYIPVIFIGLYFLAASALYENKYLRYLVLFLSPWMGIYLAASLSTLAAGLGVACSLLLVFLFHRSKRLWYVLAMALMFWVGFQSYYPKVQMSSTYKHKYSSISHSIKAPEGDELNDVGKEIPRNLQMRLDYWNFYISGIFDGPKHFFFGHKTFPDRKLYPSAHNYYLDLVYNFGVISLLPFVYLIFATISRCWWVARNGLLDPELIMLISVVGFFVIIDNSFKVGLRQPYPGMVMFFLWGMLLTLVQQLKTEHVRNTGIGV